MATRLILLPMSNLPQPFPNRFKVAISAPIKRAWHHGSDALRSTLIPPLKRLWEGFLDALSTEYHFRFQRQQIQQNLAKQRHLPRGLYIEGTNTCNAKCTFCAYPQMERPKQVMPMEDFRHAIDEYVAMGGKHVAITPIVGDPFVDPYIFDRLDDLYNRPQIQGFHFYTNAILMKPKIIDRLLQYGERLTIFVSWGGFDRNTYKALMGVDYFDLVSRNITAFIEAKQQTQSPTQLTIALRCPSSNFQGDLWQQFRTWENQGLIAMEGHNMEYDSWGGKVSDAALQQVGLSPRPKPYKRGACELLYMKPVILADGRVNACACRDVEAELIVGDLKTDRLKDIWNGVQIDQLIERHEHGDFPPVCQRCTWYISIYNSRKSTIFNPYLNWAEHNSSESRKLW